MSELTIRSQWIEVGDPEAEIPSRFEGELVLDGVAQTNGAIEAALTEEEEKMLFVLLKSVTERIAADFVDTVDGPVPAQSIAPAQPAAPALTQPPATPRATGFADDRKGYSWPGAVE